jgi:hypothetical protein
VLASSFKSNGTCSISFSSSIIMLWRIISKHDVIKIPLLVETCWLSQNTKARLQNAKCTFNLEVCLLYCHLNENFQKYSLTGENW